MEVKKEGVHKILPKTAKRLNMFDFRQLLEVFVSILINTVILNDSGNLLLQFTSYSVFTLILMVYEVKNVIYLYTLRRELKVLNIRSECLCTFRILNIFSPLQF